MRKQWEYKTSRPKTERMKGERVEPYSSDEDTFLEETGEEGWELCGSPVRDEDEDNDWVYYFKREKELTHDETLRNRIAY